MAVQIFHFCYFLIQRIDYFLNSFINIFFPLTFKTLRYLPAFDILSPSSSSALDLTIKGLDLNLVVIFEITVDLFLFHCKTLNLN